MDEKQTTPLLPEPVLVQIVDYKKQRKCRFIRVFARTVCLFLMSVIVFNAFSGSFNGSFTSCPHHMAIAKDADYHYDFASNATAGFTVEGAIASGTVKFESSRVKKEFSINVDLEYSSPKLKDSVEWIVRDNTVTLSVPAEMKKGHHINVTATISLPSDIIIGEKTLPGFALTVPDLDVDYSSLGSKLEVDKWSVIVGKGDVVLGQLKTNQTYVRLANGNITGDVSLARFNTDISIAKGNAHVKAHNSQDGRSKFTLQAADGNVTGHYPIESQTEFNIANGDLYVDVDIEEIEGAASQLTSSVASGLTRVYVNKLGADNLAFEATHNSVSGSMVLTYPESFLGKIVARNVMGDIDLRGNGLTLEKQWFGYEAYKGDDGQGTIEVRTFKGDIDFLVGKEEDEDKDE